MKYEIGLRIAGCGLRVASCGLRVVGCGLRVRADDRGQKSDYRTTMIEGFYFEMRNEAKRSRAAESIDSRDSSLLLSERAQGKAYRID